MKSLLAILSAVLLILFDQFTKNLARIHLKPITSYPIINNIFELHYVENKGAAFGILQGQRWFFIILTITMILAIVIYYVKMPQKKNYKLMRISLVLIFSGAIGNFIDRFFNHYVVDFFYFKLINFAVFNMADAYLVVGSISFALLYVFFSDDKEKLEKEV